LKVGICKEIENHIFDYGIFNAADFMCMTQEKITQYVGINYFFQKHRTSHSGLL